MSSKTYKERMKERKVYTVVCNCEVVGNFTNLKKLCDSMIEQDGEFLTYSSLSKKKKEGSPVKFTSHSGNEYQIYFESLV